MTKNDMLSGNFDAIPELQKSARVSGAGRRMLMSTVAVVTLVVVGLGGLSSASAQQDGSDTGVVIVPDVSGEVLPPPANALAPALPSIPAVGEVVYQSPPDAAPAPVSEPAPAPAPLTPEPIILTGDAPTPPMPDLSGLEGAPEPVSDVAVPPPSATVSGREATSGVTENRVVAPTTAVASDVYYDSAPGVPTGPLSNTVGPRKVDPAMEPASTMVIVQKDYGSGEHESLVVSAGRALDLGRYESALEMYDTLYKKNKNDIRILMGRAVAQQNVGYRELAIQSYEEVLKADPKNADAVINMMGILRDEYPSVALRRLLDLKERHPGNSGLMAQIGMTYAALGQMPDAVRSLNMAASMEPRNATHLYNLAVLFDRSGDPSNALKYYEQALEADAVYGAGRSIPRDQVYDRLSSLRSN